MKRNKNADGMIVPKKTLQIEVIKRFMDDEDFEQFMESYISNRQRRIFTRWTPTSRDWELYHDDSLTPQDIQKKWDISISGVYSRLGKMKVYESLKKVGKIK